MKKKGALELSIGTIVVLVLAMAMLIMGLVLVRTIFSSATVSVDELNKKVMDEISRMFADDTKVIIKLSSDKTAKIKAGTQNFGVAIGARTIDGSTVTNDLKYKIILDDSSRESCLSELGKDKVEKFIIQKVDTYLNFPSYEGDIAFSRIGISIPEGTPLCTQRIIVEVIEGDESVGRNFFELQVIRKGLF